MPTIDYYLTLLSPFTYLAGDQLETIAARRGAEIRYRPMDIMSLFAATGGTPPKDRHPNRVEYRFQELKRLSAAAGMPLTLKPKHFPTNAAPASIAVIAAEKAGFAVGGAVRGFLTAVWAEERDIADPDVVRDVLAANGVANAAIADHLAAAEAEFAASAETAAAAGAFGSPFYIVGDERFWGQDRLPHLDAYLATLGGA